VPTARLRLLSALAERCPKVERIEAVSREVEDDPTATFTARIGELLAVLVADRQSGRVEQTTAALLASLEGRDRPAPLACACAYYLLGVASYVGAGEMDLARGFFERVRLEAKLARSSSMMLYALAALGHIELVAGNLPAVEIILFDARTLLDFEETSFSPRVELASFRATYMIQCGRSREALEVLSEILDSQFIEDFMSAHWMRASGLRLLAIALGGDTCAVEAEAATLQPRIAPEQIEFFHYHVHESLTVAHLITGQGDRALAHARETSSICSVNSLIHYVRYAALLEGRALASLGRDDEAREHFERWIPRWRESKYGFLAATAHLELASLSLSALNRGAADASVVTARDHLEAAKAMAPLGSPPSALFRPPEFGVALKAALAAPVSRWCRQGQPLRIEALGAGGLRVFRKGAAATDGRHRGSRALTLLKALVALGGAQVSMTRLADLLWPDDEGQRVTSRMKVTISRLRRLGLADGEDSEPWITVRDGKVALDPAQCSVDALAFEDALRRALADPRELDRLFTALELYRGLFLEGESEGWIDAARERLDGRYVEGIHALSRRSLEAERPADALPLLERAHERSPWSERLACEWMGLLIAMGLPSEALAVYGRTCAALRREHGIEPGSALESLVQRIKSGEA
jgi:DNA-binding SARP family transcriptional activator